MKSKNISVIKILLCAALLFSIILNSFNYILAESENEFILTEEIREEVFTSWEDKFFRETENGISIGSEGFWGEAEMMETILDAYEVTGDKKYEELFRRIYNDFYKKQGNRRGNWMSNDFNDDIMWMVLVCVRAHLMFGDQEFLTLAQTHFDKTYKRAYREDTKLLRWKENHENNTVNSCINGPAEMAACYIAIATGDESYYEKAKGLYEAQSLYLYNSRTGHVYDSYIHETKEKNTWASTYNQGTYLGASVMLYNYYKDETYLEAADNIAKYTMKNMFQSDVINSEGDGADLPGFKGILMRYMRRYITDLNRPEYISWLWKNAEAAYNSRNDSGIISSAWKNKTGRNYSSAFGASTAVSLMFNALLTEETEKSASENIQAQDFNYIKGAYKEESYMTGIENNDYMGYMNIDFSQGDYKYIRFQIRDYKENIRVEVRRNSYNGELIGDFVFTDIFESEENSEWDSVYGEIDGLNETDNIFIIFRNEEQTEDLLKIKEFTFVNEKPEKQSDEDIADNKNNNTGNIILYVAIFFGIVAVSFTAVFFALKAVNKRKT